MEEKTYPFPFWGAGNAHYFEGASIAIRFVDKPTKSEKQQIKALIYNPFEYFNVNGKILVANGKEMGGFYQADNETAKKNNENVEKWLLALHKLYPIQFAVRLEDGKARESELSDWHTYSLTQTQILLEQLLQEDFPKNTSNEYSVLATSLEVIFAFSNVQIEDIPEKIITYFLPLKKFEKLVVDFVVNEEIESVAKTFLEENLTNKKFKEDLKNLLFNYTADIAKQKTKELLKISTYLLVSEQAKEIFYYLSNIILIAVEANYIPFLNTLENHIKNAENPLYAVDQAGMAAYTLMAEKKAYQAALQLFEWILHRTDYKETPNLSTYCNALWILQNDNTGFPIDVEKNHKWLAKCLAFAPQNPKVYYNAACLYVEMQDFTKAFECIELAKKHKFNSFKAMINDMKTQSFFREFRIDPRFEKYSHKN